MSSVTVALIITPHDDGSFQVTLTRHGVAVAPSRIISRAQYRGLHFITDLYRHHTRSPAPAALTEQALVTMGIELFYQWLQPDWSALSFAGESRHLAIVTDALEVLVLPWELLKPPTEDFLGVAPSWTLSRVVAAATTDHGVWSTPPRILFFQSQPVDRPPLESPLTASTGTRAALTAALRAQAPHLLWLHGHALVRHGRGHFCLCEDNGDSDIVTAAELARLISPLQGVIISGREQGHPPPIAAIHAVSRQLVGVAAPWVVAWPDAPFSRRCHPLAHALRDALNHLPLPQAITMARQHARGVEQASGSAGWTLPGLYQSAMHP